MIMLTFRYFRRQRSDEIPEMLSFFFCFFARLGVFSSSSPSPFDLLVSKLSHTWVFFLYHVKTMFVVLSFNTFCNTHISLQRLSSTGIVWLFVLVFFITTSWNFVHHYQEASCFHTPSRTTSSCLLLKRVWIPPRPVEPPWRVLISLFMIETE